MPEPNAGATPNKPGLSTFLTIFGVGIILLVMFDPALRETVGEAIGAVLVPLIGFGGRHYAWTIFFAGVILIVGTTVIRHFLIDWIGMARTQEVMRTYQKELGEARKSNNTYRLKKLMDKQPELMELQANMSKSQLKPMLFTMIIVIPLFAWLSSFVYTPIGYEVATDDGSAGILYFDTDIYDAEFVPAEGSAEVAALIQGRFVPFSFPGGAAQGAILIEDPRTEEVVATVPADDWLLPDWSEHVITNLTAGVHTLEIAEGEGAPAVRWSEEQSTRNTLGLLVPAGGGEPRVLKLTTAGQQVTVPEGGATLYAFVPVPTVAAQGETRVLVDDDEAFLAQPVSFEGTGVKVTPHMVHMPWNPTWDLLGVYILPRWILLYSLFTIPFGQVTQKLLKLIEYRHIVEEHALES